VQNTKHGKKPLANAPRYRFGISSTNDMVKISRFLEMKMKAATFKVYTSKSCEINNCFKAEVGKAFLAAAWRSERYRLRFLK
jgi:hypothetical protein